MMSPWRRTTFWLLWAVVFSLPWQGTILLPGIGTLSRVVGLLAAITGVIAWSAGGRRAPLGDGLLPLVVLGAWSTVSLLWTSDVDGTVAYTVTMVQLVLLAVLVWDFTEDLHDVRRLLWAWVLGAYVGAAGVMSAVASAADAERSSAFGFNENDLGALLALAVPMAWYLGGAGAGTRTRVIAWGYLPVGAVAVLSTASRGALLVLVVAAAVVPLTTRIAPLATRAATRRRWLAVAAVSAVAVGLVAVAVPDAAQERLGSLGAEVRSGDLNERTPLWAAAVEVAGERPALGTAAGASDLEVTRRVGYPMGVHNTFLSLTMQLGFVGVAAFSLALLVAALRARGLPRRERRVSQVLLAALLVAMVPLHWELQKGVWVALALLAVLAAHAAPPPERGAGHVRSRTPDHVR